MTTSFTALDNLQYFAARSPGKAQVHDDQIRTNGIGILIEGSDQTDCLFTVTYNSEFALDEVLFERLTNEPRVRRIVLDEENRVSTACQQLATLLLRGA
jgi:hypothetical protein